MSLTVSLAGIFKPMDDKGDGRRFLQTLEATDGRLLPERYGENETEMKRATGGGLDQFVVDWGDTSFLWHRRNPYVEGTLFTHMKPNWPHAHLSLQCEFVDTAVGSWAELLIMWGELFQPAVSFVHLLTPSEIERGLRSEYLAASGGRKNKHFSLLTSFRLLVDLPDLWWGTCLGKPYVDLVGRERLLATPAFRIVEASDGGVFIQLTKSIEDVQVDPDGFAAARSAAVTHIGTDLFFVHGRQNGLQKRVPVFS